MSMPNLLFNRDGRLRSGWRLALFACAYISVFLLLTAIVWLASYVALGSSQQAVLDFYSSNWAFVIQSFLLLTAALVTSWACQRWLEDLPFRALGWARHRGWVRDFWRGSFVGAASMIFATGLAALGGGLRFEASTAEVAPLVLRTLLISAAVFIPAAAAEEAVFRGYPLQTVLRSWPAWLAVIPCSLAFAYVHLGNPNVARGWTLINTALAGVWLAAAYLKTRSLWFPLGVHWAWNWTMGAVLGLPVSGITALTPQPLLRANQSAPEWLTGGSYGIEGGAACTFALIVSTGLIWRTRYVSATPEMKDFTTAENPVGKEKTKLTQLES